MSNEQTPGGTPQPRPTDAAEDTKPADAPASNIAKPSGASTASEKDGFGTVSSFLAKIVRVIFAPTVWLLRPLIFRIRTDQGVPKVYFTSFSTLMYLWPIMLVGWVGCLLVHFGLVTEPTPILGWIWITVVLVVLLCIGSDTDRNKTVVMGMIGLLLWTGGLLLEEKKGIPILSHVYDFLAAQNVQFEPGTANVLSIATCIILVCVVFSAWFDGRYEITTREISHKRVLRTSDSLPRAAKRIKRDWRDLTEVFLGLGAGDLIVLDSNKNIVMRIANIPFLWFFRHDVDHILEVLATTDVDEIAAVEEEEID